MEHIVKVCVHLKHDCRCINDNTYINHYFEMTLSDIDECARDTHTCHKNANCSDTYGSYSCVCKTGYEGNGFFNCTST